MSVRDKIEGLRTIRSSALHGDVGGFGDQIMLLADELDSLRNHCEKSIVGRFDETDRSIELEKQETDKAVGEIVDRINLLHERCDSLRAAAEEREKKIAECEQRIAILLDTLETASEAFAAEVRFSKQQDENIARLQGDVKLLQQMHAGHEPAAYHHSDTGA